MATVRWYKDTLIMEQTDKRRMESFGNKNVLHLRMMEKEGLYQSTNIKASLDSLKHQILVTTPALLRTVLV